ncbi:sporulation protein YqfD [Paenibacillus sp. CAU 1782]
MKGQGVIWVKGEVVVEIRGGSPEELVNKCLAGGLSLSSIARTSNGVMRFTLSVSDFFRLRPYLKETSCRVHVISRHGLPFLLRRAERRIGFAAGLTFFFVLLFLLSSLVWSVDVEGNTRLTREEVLNAAKSEGLYPMQWSFRLQDADVLSKRLVSALPGTTWVGVEKKGTKVRIQVVEMTLPEKPPLQNPRHLVASADAVITQIVAETGKAVVKKNTRVKAGQTLISGIIGSETNNKTVVAQGTVRGLVWYEYDIASPMVQKVKVYTGDKKTRWYAVIGSRALQVSGFGNPGFEQSESIEHMELLSWRKWSLPVGRMKETIMDAEMRERELTQEEAKNNGILGAKADIMEKAGIDVLFRDEIVLHEKAENGKVYMKVLFEVEQSIVKELPIVQMQGD